MWIFIVLGASVASGESTTPAMEKRFSSPAGEWDLTSFLTQYVHLQGFNSVHFLRDSNGEDNILCYLFLYFFYLSVFCERPSLTLLNVSELFFVDCSNFSIRKFEII